MRSRSSVILAISFGILVTLIAILGIGAVRKAKSIYEEMQRTQESYMRTEAFRRDIASDMYLADILVRDYLLDPSPQNVKQHREQLLKIRESLQNRMDSLASHMGSEYTPRLQQIQDEVQAYWESLDPTFDWTPQDKAEKSWGFLRHKVLPRRETVVSLAREIARANQKSLEAEQARIKQGQQTLRSFLIRMMTFSLVLGALVATVTVYRVAVLEGQHESQRAKIEEAEADQRRLARKLVQAQETERKSLSRELHDEVGQTLTALGMELANIEAMRTAEESSFRDRIDEAKRLNAEAMRSVRGLAMGLRPSMLDDLGLEPALEWQGREFSRHTGVPATVRVKGGFDDLDDQVRTCIYRVVQEALTNCARHAHASHVEISVTKESEKVLVEIKDNGKGFDVRMKTRTGLGLIGMKERVESLGGELSILSSTGTGTAVSLHIPVSTGVAA
ncbi:MAG TPA: ATP-binding protein [Terriglobales bacterium]|nr:ATP-binding protein [Terriglobales bacterium]